MRARVLVPLAALAAAGAAAAVVATRPGADLHSEFERRLAEMTPAAPGEPVTEADLAHLPPPVATWLRRAGAVGRPRVSLVHTTFEATLWNAPGEAGMSGLAHQVDRLDPPRRLFFMTTRMVGLPVQVLHDYRPESAGMRVRAGRLLDVVDLEGPDFARIESVTFLNDLCAYMPSALIRPEFAWTPLDDRSARVAYAVGPHTVTATLFFDEAGDLVDFASDDRADVSGGDEPVPMRWSTPLSEVREVEGRRVPGRGEAVWHRPDGPFTYGTFTLKNASFDRLGDR